MGLIAQEYRVRHRWGDRPSHAEYAARFAGRGAALRQALARIDAHLDAEHPRGDGRTPYPPGLPEWAGRCRIVGEIARGGMGMILQGHDPQIGRDLAVKLLLDRYQGQPHLVARFLAEAQVSGQLQHPGVVPVHEVGQCPDGRPYFTMKLVRGRTLAALLGERTDPAQDQPRFLKVFEQVCQTLAYAHSRGVIHRDLKPANVMVGSFGEVQVMDWGLAKVLSPARGEHPPPGPDESVVRTLRSGRPDAASWAGCVVGTPAYMAPEQARGEVEQLHERCDVFGLGAILCEILTGQPPYTGSGADVLLLQVTRGDLTDTFARLDACGADAELLKLARRCLAPRPEDRARDAGEVAGELSAYLASVEQRLRAAELAGAEARARAAQEWRAWRLTAALAAAALLLVSLAGVGGWWYQRQRAARDAELLARQVATERDVLAALQEARKRNEEGWEQAHYPERWRMTLGLAFSALRRADGLLDSGAPTEGLPEQVRRVQAELEEADAGCRLAARLDSVRMQSAVTREGRWAYRETAEQYAKAFHDHGLDVLQMGPEEMKQVLARHRLREWLLVALVDWIPGAPEGADRNRLLEVVRAADPDADSFRSRWREALVRRDSVALAGLADEVRVEALPAVAIAQLGRSLKMVGAGEAAVRLLREGQARHPDDFWLNFGLAGGFLEMKPPRPEEAVRFLTAAVALRRQSAPAHVNLGIALHAQGDVDGAIRCHRAARELDPKFAPAHYNLGMALQAKGDLDEAIRACRAGLEVAPTDAKAHGALGYVLLQQGRFAEARQYTQRSLELLPDRDPLRNRAIQQLKQCEQLLAVDEKLPAILKGDARPRDAAERLALAYLCWQPYQRRYAAAARFYADAFAEQPKLADDPRTGARYNAAGAAALAAASKGKDTDQLDDKERAHLRAQALDWLQADLARWTEQVDKGTPQVRMAAQRMLTHWQKDAALASLCDQEVLGKLPEAEREAWRKLWADVDALLARTHQPQ